MQVITYASLCTLFILSSPCVAQSPVRAGDLLTSAVAEKGVAGISAAYAVEGETIWAGAEGYACADDEIPFTQKTITRTASIAKSMTAVAVMQLVQQDKIDLDKPVREYLPDFPSKPKGDIEVRHLLSHTSGISGYQSAKEAESTVHYASLAEAMNVFKDRDLLFEPGTDFFYTTYGYVVLGRIIEEVSGMPYGKYMRKYIFEPAGMVNTGVEDATRLPSERSCLYHRNKRRPRPADRNDLSNRIPGGGLYSTVEDLIAFGNAVLHHVLIDSATFELMTEKQFQEKEGNPYGLGWFMYGPPPNEDLVIGHSGEQTGAATQLMLIPKSRTVVVVLANTSGTWKDVVTLASGLIRISEETHGGE